MEYLSDTDSSVSGLDKGPMAAHENHEGGHPPELFVLPVDHNYTCPICLDVAREPIQCNNGHLFCAGCIGSWLENNKTCPVDRAPLRKGMLSSNRIVANVLSGLDVRCLTCCSAPPPVPTATVVEVEALSSASSFFSFYFSSSSSSSSSSSCSSSSSRGTKRKATESEEDAPPAPLGAWTGKLSELAAHTSQCPHVLVNCTLEGCALLVPRGEFASHVSSCTYRLKACTYGCGANVKVRDMQSHKKNCCPRRPTQCPNAGCDLTLRYDELQAHREQHCLFEKVACPFAASVGCQHRCIRRDMAAHSTDVTAHFAGMMETIARQQTELQQQRTTVQQQQTKVQVLERENRQMKETVGWVNTKMQGLETTVQQQQTTVQGLETTVQQQQTTVKQQKKTVQQQRDELEQQRDELQQQRDELQQQKTTMQQQKTKVQGLKTELKQQKTELQQEKTELQQQLLTNSQVLETKIQKLMKKQANKWVHETFIWEVTGCTVPSCMFSPAFNVGGFEFKLDLYSAQTEEEDRKNFTGLYLHMEKGWKTRVKMEFQIINANDNSVSTSFSGKHTYEHLMGWGALKLLSNEVMETYLNDGKVTVRAIVSVELPDDLASAQILTKEKSTISVVSEKKLECIEIF